MSYAQENYPETLGSGPNTTTLAKAGCFVTAFSNLLERLGVGEVPPNTLNSFFVQHGTYITESDGAKDLLAWSSITAYDGNVRVTASGSGAPTSDNSIVKFIYNGGTTHFCLVESAANHTIVDSWDGKVKNWSVYGGPVQYASYTNATPAPTTTAKPQPVNESAYNLVVAVPGYGTSNNAANHTNQADTVPAGQYSVFNEANGMVNVTTKPGVAGSWINPADNKAPAAAVPAAPSDGAYTVVKDIPGYGNANNAANHIDQADTVHPGNYHIFNQADGMVNVTSNPGTPGSWINPADNVAAAVSSASSGLANFQPLQYNKPAMYTLVAAVLGYETATNAGNHVDSVVTLQPGSYYVFASYPGRDDLINISSTNAKPGAWINTADNVEPPAPEPAPEPEPAATPEPAEEAAPTSNGNTVTPDQSWQDSYKQFPAGAVHYVSTRDLTVEDLSGQAPTMPLPRETKVSAYGTVVKDGVTYYRLKTGNDPSFKLWYCVPQIDQQTGTANLLVLPAPAAPVKKTTVAGDALQLGLARIEEDAIKFLDIVPKWFSKKK